MNNCDFIFCFHSSFEKKHLLEQDIEFSMVARTELPLYFHCLFKEWVRFVVHAVQISTNRIFIDFCWALQPLSHEPQLDNAGLKPVPSLFIVIVHLRVRSFFADLYRFECIHI